MNDLDKGSKRGAKYEVYTLSRRFFRDLRHQIESKNLEYKTNKDFFQSRDKALVTGLVLTGLRASEISLLKPLQIQDDDSRLRLLKVRTVKGGDLRAKIPLPTQNELGEYTKIFLRHVDKIPDRASFIFPRGSGLGINFDQHISRKRVYQIVNGMTGLYPHYFRSVHASIYAKVFGFDAWKLKAFMGWKNLNSSSPYVKSNWESDENKIDEVY